MLFTISLLFSCGGSTRADVLQLTDMSLDAPRRKFFIETKKGNCFLQFPFYLVAEARLERTSRLLSGYESGRAPKEIALLKQKKEIAFYNFLSISCGGPTRTDVRQLTDMSATSYTPGNVLKQKKEIAFYNFLSISCGGPTRTDDLWVMSPTSYHCSTPRSVL